MRVGLFRRPVMCDPPSAAAISVLAGKLAGVDGPVNASELSAFYETFLVPSGQRDRLGRLMQHHGTSPENFQTQAVRFGRLHRNRTRVMRWALDGLKALAEADGPIHPLEIAFIARSAAIWHLPLLEDETDTHRSEPEAQGVTRAFHVLGVPEDATESVIREQRRRLASQLHPDRYSDDRERSAAETQLREINAAYGQVIRFRRRRD